MTTTNAEVWFHRVGCIQIPQSQGKSHETEPHDLKSLVTVSWQTCQLQALLLFHVVLMSFRKTWRHETSLWHSSAHFHGIPYSQWGLLQEFHYFFLIIFEAGRTRFSSPSVKISFLPVSIFKVILEPERSSTKSQREEALSAWSKDPQPLASATFQIYNLQKQQLLDFQSDGI